MDVNDVERREDAEVDEGDDYTEKEDQVSDGWRQGWSEATAIIAMSNIYPPRFARNPLARRFAPRAAKE